MINYQIENYSVVQYENHLNDGVKLHVTAPTSKQAATLSITTITGETYTETHVLHDGKTIFNLSEYFRESMPLNWRRLVYVPATNYLPFPLYNNGSTLLKNAVAPYSVASDLSIDIDGKTLELTASDLECFFGYTKHEPTARLHLFNPNFEAVAEYIPTATHVSTDYPTGYTLFGLCYNRNNGGEISWYRHTLGSRSNVRQVRLNDYWDARYSKDGIMLDFVTNETATETTSYIIDTRTKGAYLRFLDANGMLQQLLLDIESQESTYEDGDLLQQYDGGERYFVDGLADGSAICSGHGKTATRTETNCLHCSISNAPRGLTGDIKALLLSPVVLMYCGKTDDGANKWERVRVVPNASIIEETKKAQISAKIDIYPIFENNYRV